MFPNYILLPKYVASDKSETISGGQTSQFQMSSDRSLWDLKLNHTGLEEDLKDFLKIFPFAQLDRFRKLKTKIKIQV